MNNIYNLIARAHELRKETQLGSISPERVGSILEDTCKYLNEAQIFADALIQKVYATEEAFNNDTERLSDLTGKPMKAGSIIYIRSNDTFYRYDGGNTKTVLKENALDQLLSVKADKDGVYPDLTAGDLAGRGESVPAEFGFRASGGKSIKDGRAYIKRIKGNSVVWNQLCKRVSNPVSANGITIIDNGDSYTISGTAEANTRIPISNFFENINTHIYCMIGCPQNGSISTYYLEEGYTGRYDSGNGYIGSFSKTSNQNHRLGILVKSGVTISSPLTFRPKVFNLTKMFGAGNEPTTIEEFYQRIPQGIDITAYNEGEIIDMRAEGIKSVGDNAWDEQWRNGIYGSTNGIVNLNQKDFVCNLNPIRVLPSAEYSIEIPTKEGYAFLYDENMQYLGYEGTFTTIKTPSNAYYMNFYAARSYGNTYKHDIIIRLVHSGWKQDTDAGYQPYWQDTLPLPIIRKYFPQGMKKAGSAHDEIRFNKASGKWEVVQRIKAVKMKDLNWSLAIASNNNTSFTASLQDIRQPSVNEERIDGALIAKYYPTTGNPNTGALVDKCWVRVADDIYIKDDAFASAEAFANSLNDNDILYYELADPIVTELDAEDQNFRDYYNVADFGTEMSQSSVPSANFSADIIYQFNAVDMIREHELEITELQNIMATMQAKLDILTNKEEILE